MISLFEFLQRNAHVFLFILFEFLSFYLIVTYNQGQRKIFLYSSSLITGAVEKRSDKFSEYFSLKNENSQLVADNAALLEEVINNRFHEELFVDKDTTFKGFEVIPADIVSQSIQSMRNFITLNKGKEDGILQSMGVISRHGVVGIVKAASDHYTKVMSLLNLDTRISASIKGKNYYGTLSWPGREFNKALLSGIPTYADVLVGDTIVTNGYSTIFPKGIPIGKISNYKVNRDGVFYDIDLELLNDFTNLDHVFIVKNNFAWERTLLQDE